MQPTPRNELAADPRMKKRGKHYFLDGKQVIPAEEIEDFLQN